MEKEQLLAPLTLADGEKLPVPILRDSPLCYELKVRQTIHLEGSEIFICGIENTLVDAALVDPSGSYDLSRAKPAAVSQMKYFTLSPHGRVGDCK